MLLEPPCEDREMALGELQPRGRGVAAKGEKPLGAIANRLVKVEAWHRPRRALGELVAEGHDHRRAIVDFNQAACHDADHAGMPAFLAQNDGAAISEPTPLADHL